MHSRVCHHFNDFLFDFGMVDMGFIGPKYTWRRGSLFQRLDRCLCNSIWYEAFLDSEVYHLLKLGSDHQSIMLDSLGQKEDHVSCSKSKMEYESFWTHRQMQCSIDCVAKSYSQTVDGLGYGVSEWEWD
ncbi:hypothetical protein GQ457_05G025040 [Hibiscus cannabinus]